MNVIVDFNPYLLVLLHNSINETYKYKSLHNIILKQKIPMLDST